MAQPSKSRTPVVEEDIDELDDLLEQFTPASSKAKTSGISAPPTTAVPATADPTPKAGDATKPGLNFDDFNIEDDFAQELAKGMAELMRNIAAESTPGGDDEPSSTHADLDKEREQESVLRKAWEDMLVEGMNGAVGPEELATGASSSSKGKGKGSSDINAELEDNFQESIRKAMEKLKESDSNLQAESASATSDPFESLLAQLGEGGENEEELEGIIEGMMKQLMSKSILYEPLKELSDKFPSYLTENASTIKPEDKERYLSQQKLVDEIVAIYDDPKYAEDNVEQNTRITTLMNDMQQLGSPPPEIMGPLPPGFDIGPDGMPKLPDGCVIA